MRFKGFKYELKEKVRTTISGEQGSVIGRSEHLNGENQYHVRLRTTQGNQQEQWFAESAIVEDAK